MSRSAVESERRPAIIIIGGEGGHLAQARRLCQQISESNRVSADLILLTDHQMKNNLEFDEVFPIPNCAPKDRRARLSELSRYFFSQFHRCVKLLRNYKICLVVVTGPGFAVFPALTLKLCGATLIVFESWSRFEKRSKCGKALYHFSDHFWVQHKELLEIYPRATWVGLL